MTDSASPASSAGRRAELLGCLICLAVFIAIRLAAAQGFTLLLEDGEEYLHLRLAWQLSEGLPVGALGDYAYPSAQLDGVVEGGALVLALLYVPLHFVLGDGFWTVRIMGLLWTVVGVGLVMLLARRICGRWGALAVGVASLGLPVRAIIGSLRPMGNYLEAAVIGVFLIGLVSKNMDASSPRAKRVLPALFGAVAAFAVWFSPISLVVVFLCLPVVLVNAPRRIHWLVLGLCLGATVWLVDIPSPPRAAPSSPAALVDMGSSLLERPGVWGSVLIQTLGGFDLGNSCGQTPPPERRDCVDLGIGPDWLQEVVRWTGWGGVFLLLLMPLVGRRFGIDGHGRVLCGIVGLATLGVPLACSVAGGGPLSVPLPRLITFDDIRIFSIYFGWSLGWGLALHIACRMSGRLRLGSRVVSGGLVVTFALPAVCLSAIGQPPPEDYRPASYVLCPTAEPRTRTFMCVHGVRYEDVAALNRILDDPDILSVEQRREALLGFDSVQDCSVDTRVRPGETGPDFWRQVGVAAGIQCSGVAARLCEVTVPAGPLRSDCLAGVASANSPGGLSPR